MELIVQESIVEINQGKAIAILAYNNVTPIYYCLINSVTSEKQARANADIIVAFFKVKEPDVIIYGTEEVDYEGMYNTITKVHKMQHLELLEHIDGLYGRKALPDEYTMEELRAEAVKQTGRFFRKKDESDVR